MKVKTPKNIKRVALLTISFLLISSSGFAFWPFSPNKTKDTMSQKKPHNTKSKPQSDVKNDKQKLPESLDKTSENPDEASEIHCKKPFN